MVKYCIWYVNGIILNLICNLLTIQPLNGRILTIHIVGFSNQVVVDEVP